MSDIKEFRAFVDACVKRMEEAKITFDDRNRFIEAVISLALKNRRLLTANRHSLALSLRKAALSGLLPDGIESTIMVARGGEGAQYVEWIPMVRGLLRLAYESGVVIWHDASVVYEGETFKVIRGKVEDIEHQQNLGSIESNKPVGVYAIVELSTGRRMHEVMSWREVLKRRDAFAMGGKSESPAWKIWPEEMAIKTVIKSLLSKRVLPLVAALQKRGEGVERLKNAITMDGVEEVIEAVNAAEEAAATMAMDQLEADEPTVGVAMPSVAEAPAPAGVAATGTVTGYSVVMMPQAATFVPPFDVPSMEAASPAAVALPDEKEVAAMAMAAAAAAVAEPDPDDIFEELKATAEKRRKK